MNSEPEYADAPSVIAGLERMRGELADITTEISSLIDLVRPFLGGVPPGAVRARVDEALIHQQAQFAWLPSDFLAMRSALGFAPQEEKAMPTPRRSQPEVKNPISHLYVLSESLLHLCATQPEERAGLGMLLYLLAGEVRHCAERLDDSEE